MLLSLKWLLMDSQNMDLDDLRGPKLTGEPAWSRAEPVPMHAARPATPQLPAAQVRMPSPYEYKENLSASQVACTTEARDERNDQTCGDGREDEEPSVVQAVRERLRALETAQDQHRCHLLRLDERLGAVGSLVQSHASDTMEFLGRLETKQTESQRREEQTLRHLAQIQIQMDEMHKAMLPSGSSTAAAVVNDMSSEQAPVSTANAPDLPWRVSAFEPIVSDTITPLAPQRTPDEVSEPVEAKLPHGQDPTTTRPAEEAAGARTPSDPPPSPSAGEAVQQATLQDRPMLQQDGRDSKEEGGDTEMKRVMREAYYSERDRQSREKAKAHLDSSSEAGHGIAQFSSPQAANSPFTVMFLLLSPAAVS